MAFRISLVALFALVFVTLLSSLSLTAPV